jgi:hypothetical protein
VKFSVPENRYEEFADKMIHAFASSRDLLQETITVLNEIGGLSTKQIIRIERARALYDRDTAEILEFMEVQEKRR